MNIIDAMNVFYREDVISDFLVNCFRDSNAFLEEFLQKANISVKDGTAFHLDTRVGLGKNIGTPDIVIRGRTGDSLQLIVVENKMGAAEGREQTNRYASSAAKAQIAAKYGVPKEDIRFHFIFLALDTTASPRHTDFTFLNYDLFLQGNWRLHDDTLQIIFRDFQQKIQQFYRPLQQPMESLESDVLLDSMQRKICWHHVLYEAFRPKKELVLEWGETGGAGRSNFLFLISKDSWTSDKPFGEEGLGGTLNVHVDLYVNMLDGGAAKVKEIGVRFETFPYAPHNQIKHLEGYGQFLENKQVFAQRLLVYALREGVPAQRRNSKLLAMTVKVAAGTVQETIENFQRMFAALAPCIDQVIQEMKEEGLIAT